MPNLTGTGIVVLLLAQGLAGCGGSSPQGPSGQPPPGPAGGTPSVSALSPIKGSTAGGTSLRITGGGFQPGATVTLGDQPGTTTVENSATLHVTTPAHATGLVDVVVTNPNGLTSRLAGGYTYASPQSFDFNGTWDGAALAHPEGGADVAPFHSDMPLRFTVLNNRLTGFTCDTVTVTFSPPLSVVDGEFSFTGTDSVEITGRIVSDMGAVGTINTVPCPHTRWAATKQ